MVKIFTRKALGLVLSDEDKYFLRSAASDKSIFKFPSAKSKATEEDQWSTIWNVLKASRKTKKCLMGLKAPLQKLNEELQSAVKTFIDAEGRMIKVTRKISKEIQEKVINELKFKKVKNMLKWVDEVHLKDKSLDEG